MIEVKFDGQEKKFLYFENLNYTHSIDNNLAFKRLELTAYAGSNFGSFLAEIRSKREIYVRVKIKDRLLMEDYVTIDSFPFSFSSPSGFSIRLSLFDRFYSLAISDLVKTRPTTNIQKLLSDALSELNFAGKKFKYQKPITKTSDFIKLNGLKPSELKTFKKKDFISFDSSKMIGEACSIANVVVISNGYDTLSIEKQNSFKNPVFELRQKSNNSDFGNITYMEKAVYNQYDQTPSRFIILNSADNDDNNKGIVAEYIHGKPNVQKINRVSFDARYQDISKSLNYGLLGITARQNSYVYKSPVILDKDGNFFQPNRFITVKHDAVGIDEDMNILQYGLSVDGKGNIESTFNLTTQNAFDNNASLQEKRSLMK